VRSPDLRPDKSPLRGRALLKLIDWRLLWITLAIYVAISAAGWWYYDVQKARITGERYAEIFAIADLKVAQIEQWRQERLIDILTLFSNPYVEKEVAEIAAGRATPSRNREMADWLEKARADYSFHNIVLFDVEQRVLINSGPPVLPLNMATGAYLAETVADAKGQVSDLFIAKGGGIVMEIYSPLFAPGPARKVVAVLMVRIDPRVKLYPFIQSWPTPSRSFEIVLFRREGDDALILNDLRHRKGSALSMRMRASELGLPRSSASRFQETAFDTIDYRGVPVVAALIAVPGTPWFLLAKEDREEMFRPLADFQLFMGISMGLLFSITGAVLVVVWFRRHEEELMRMRM
jgi:hypothetical protein